VGGGRLNREDAGGRIWWVYFVYVYERRTMKTVEVIVRRGRRRMRENDGGDESN
jgi:hypothetical protein